MGQGGRRRAGCGDPTHTYLWRVNTVTLHYIPACRPPPCLQPEPGRPPPRAGTGQALSGCVGRALRSSLG